MLIATLALLSACGLFDDNDESWMPHCDSSETVLAWDEASALGFSGEDLALALGSTATSTLEWAEGGSTALSLGVVWSDEAVFVDQWEAEPPDDVDDYAAIWVECPDYLAVQATVDFATDDGLLADSFSTHLRAESLDGADYSIEADRTEFAHPEIFDPYLDPDATAEGADIWGHLLSDGTTSGTLSFTTQGEDGDVAWADNAEVATW